MCDCVVNINAEMLGENAKLVHSFIVNPHLHSVVTIAVTRINPMGPRAVGPRARFCPFCGDAYPSAAIEQVGFSSGPAEDAGR